MAPFSLPTLFGRSKLTPLERKVLLAVSAELSPPAREIFDKQMELVNLVQRHVAGKEVNFYHMRRGKPSYDERFLFPLRSEIQLARVEMIGGNAEVLLVEGWVFSIHFDKSPRNILESGTGIDRIEILHDPMVDSSEDSSLQQTRREQLLATICSKLPSQYLQMVGGSIGMLANNWTVYDIQDIRKIVQQDGNYYLLAEKEGMGGVGVKEGESSGQLYYLDYGDDRGEMITVSLRQFLDEFDGGKVRGRF